MNVRVGDKEIGDGYPTFIIAEMGANHNGSIEMAKKIIDKAKWAGADAIKIQTWKADKIIAAHDESIEWLDVDYLRRYEFNWGWLKELTEYCKEKDIMFFSTVDDYDDCDLLEKLNTPLYKRGSLQITDHPKLKYFASTGKPIMMSTGGSTIEEIKEAIQVIEDTGNNQIIILQCTSLYPSATEQLDLRVITRFKELFPYPIGFSGHSLSIYPAIAAVALGACVIEKHFTLDRNLEGPDHPFATEPDELKTMVEAIRIVEKALGKSEKYIYPEERKLITIARRSIIAKHEILKGTKITQDMLDTARAGAGIKASLENYEEKIPGKIANRNLKARERISWDMLDEAN